MAQITVTRRTDGTFRNQAPVGTGGLFLCRAWHEGNAKCMGDVVSQFAVDSE
jgi:hypothetical protein